MKIKLLTILGGLSEGGAQHMAYELIRSLDKSKYECVVLCSGRKVNSALEKKLEKVCQVIYCDHTGRITPKTFLSVMRAISHINPDIIHAHMGSVAFAIPWTRFHKKPLVVTVHTKPEKAFSKKNENQVRRALRRHNFRLIAVSEDNYYKVQEYFNINDEHVSFINNGIDINRYGRQPHEGFAFVNVARQDENKNQAAIVRAFRRIVDDFYIARLYLVGDGPCHNDLIELSKSLGLTDYVHIPGQTANPEEYYAVSDVYVQSSHREAMPLSVLEAMAAGLPIISTDVGGLRDVVKDNGILVPDDDEENLYNAMRTFLQMSGSEFDKMSAVSKKIVEEYSSDKMAERYSTVYQSIL